MAVQSLTAMESKYNEPSEGDNGSGAGLVSRARMPLTLNPRKKSFTRIPPALDDTTSRPAGHASRRRTHWRSEQADARNKTHKQKKKHQKHERQSTNTPQRNLAVIALHHTAHARALVFWKEAPPFSPRSHSHRESISSSSSSSSSSRRPHSELWHVLSYNEHISHLLLTHLLKAPQPLLQGEISGYLTVFPPRMGCCVQTQGLRWEINLKLSRSSLWQVPSYNENSFSLRLTHLKGPTPSDRRDILGDLA